METVYLGLGSNVGDRCAYLTKALALLNQNSVVIARVSPLYETEPVDGPPHQGDYLNAVVEIQSSLPHRELLALCKRMETELGRKERERFGPREIDIDILLWGNLVVKETGLEIPHPRLHERRFALAPLADLAPYAIHPVLRLTIVELLETCADDSRVRKLGGALMLP